MNNVAVKPTMPEPVPSQKHSFRALSAYLPYVAFCLWMVGKLLVSLMAAGLWPGLGTLIATGGSFLVISPWFYRSEWRRRLLLMALLDLVITFVLFVDILYARQFGDLVSVASLRFASQLGTVGDSVLTLVKPLDLLLWADVAVIASLALLRRRPAHAWLGLLQKTRLSLKASACLALLGAVSVTAVALLDPHLSIKYYGHSWVARRMGLLNYHLFDVGNYVGRLSIRLFPSAEATAEVEAYFASERFAPATEAPLQGIARDKNVIILQVESLQAFAVGLKVNGQEITPNINRLAAESLNFTDFYAQIGQGVTSDADLLSNCSLYPTRTGAVYYDYADNDLRCMPWLMRQYGYKAVAMQGMPPDFWNLARVYPHVGYETYYNLKNGFVADEEIGVGLSDGSFVRQAAAHLKALPEPYYAFLVTLTSHVPFSFENLPRELKLGELEGTKAGDYLHAVHYTDQAIGTLMDQLKADGTLDRSVLVLYGDHAGVYQWNTGIPELLGLDAKDEVGWTRMEKRVPFMIRLPEGAHAGEHHGAAGQVDIAPTMAGLLGVPTDSAYFFGRNILAHPSGLVAFNTGSALTDDLLFSSRGGNPAMGKCYDRKTGGEMAIDRCSRFAEEAAEALRISRLLVERNLIGQLPQKSLPSRR